MLMAENYRERLFGFLKSRAVGQPGELFTEASRERPSSAPRSGDDLGARFCSELNAVGGEASDLASSADPAAELGGWLQGLGLKTAVIDSDPRWKVTGLPIREIVEGAGLELERVDASTLPAELAEVDLGITLADAAIAETGTIAQCASPFRPRSISLVPRCHLVLVPADRPVDRIVNSWPADRLLASLEDLFEGISSGAEWAGGPEGFASYFTWMTGPSRTADIEKTLTIGVHGPARTGAFLLGEESQDD